MGKRALSCFGGLSASTMSTCRYLGLWGRTSSAPSECSRRINWFSIIIMLVCWAMCEVLCFFLEYGRAVGLERISSHFRVYTQERQGWVAKYVHREKVIVSMVVSARRNAELSTFFLYAACLHLWCTPLINHLPSSCSGSCMDVLQSVVISYSGADKSTLLLSQLLLHKQPHWPISPVL